ncbi:MAG: DUF2079 domain-containing protein [Candidatus Omnitrophota bacterium]|nr:DUF2079 domain-containing protein [Candidatus Omnitrophota bacterium]
MKVSLCRYANFNYGDWDLAIYNQTFRNLISGRSFISLIGVHFLQNHIEITPAVLIAPIYALFPHPVTLLAIQSLMLALAAIPLFLIARKLLSEAWGLVFVIIYLLYPAVGYTNLNEFHPESFLPFIQFCLLYFFIKNDFKKFAIFNFLCLLSKENMSLILIMLSVYALIEKKEKKWFALPFLSGFLYLLFYGLIILPNLAQAKSISGSLYAHLGATPAQMAKTIIFHPIAMLKFIAMPQKMEYLFNLFGPLSFLSFLNPVILLAVLPNFLQHLLSLRETETTLYYYYPSEMLAFIFVSAVFGLKFLLKSSVTQKYKYLISATIIFVALSFSIRLGPQPDISRQIRKGCLLTGDAIEKDNFIKIIPKNSSVIATFNFLPKLSNITDSLYSLHRVLAGTSLSEDSSLLVLDQPEFALIDFDDSMTFYNFYQPYAGYADLRSFLARWQLRPVRALENTVLFKRDYKGDFGLYESVGSALDSNLKADVFDGSIKIIGYKLEKNIFGKKDKILITFFWQALGKIAKDYSLSIVLVDSSDMIRQSMIHPLCYRIYPTSSWQEEEIVKENYWFSISSGISSGKYKIYVGILDPLTGKLCNISPADTKKEIGWVELCGISIL